MNLNNDKKRKPRKKARRRKKAQQQRITQFLLPLPGEVEDNVVPVPQLTL